MPYQTQPNTLGVAQAIVGYMSALTYPSTSTAVFTLAQLEAIKDCVDLTANGGVCCEVYGDMDTSERHGFGGRVWDTQTFFILALCALDTPAHAQQIYSVRDAIVLPFQQHSTLNNQVSTLFLSQLKPNGKFFRVQRSGQWMRSYLCELEVKQEWQVQGGVIS